MDAATVRIAQGLEQAMKAELDGHHFYLMAARSTTDEQGRRVFETLAAEELDHLRVLKEQHAALRATGLPAAQTQLGPRLVLDGVSPIFSPALQARAREAHFEMSALSIAIQLELGAVEFYARLAEQALQPALRAFFTELVDWERGHYQGLLRQQDALKDDYWSAGGFSPF